MSETEIRMISGGINQLGVRAYNEQLILSMIQRFGALPGSDLAKHAGLSPQTVSVILRRLEKDGLLKRGEPQRGRVGKPSIPMALDPDGVLTVGMKIGRRTADLVLMDLVGAVRAYRQASYRYPMPDQVFRFLQEGLDAFGKSLKPPLRARLAGIGIAAPFEIWNWHETLQAPRDEFAVWKEIDIGSEIARFSDLPVLIENDATAACRAEQVFGRGPEFRDYAYFFLGSFIGGGVVLNHSVFEGPHANAGAFGSLPTGGADGRDRQLIDTASIHLLEGALEAAGEDPKRLWTQPQDWSGFDSILNGWIDRTGAELARAAVTVCAVIDFEAVLIDGAFPEQVRHRLVARAAETISRLDTRGIVVPRVEAGRVGANARALGAACAPLFSKYLLNTHAGLAVG